MSNTRGEANVTVIIGERIYASLNWTRKDIILRNGEKIGHIHLSGTDRAGETVAKNGQKKKGRAIDWCVELALEAQHAST